MFAAAQYVGKVDDKPATPTLRAVGVLEWTGAAGKPKFARLVPVSIFDGDQLQDAGVYLARPEPLALEGEVEYLLKKNGHTIGLFDIQNSGREQGSWVGFGSWKPVPHPKPVFAATAPDFDYADDDKPILHRKHHAEDAPGGSGQGSGSAPDGDRPVLHRPLGSDSASNSAGSAPVDPDRPVLKEPQPAPPPTPAHAEGNVSPVPLTSMDPDRPHLIRGEVNGQSLRVTPTLMGLPPDMQQMVAVSDAANRPEHVWSYTWANEADQDKMKSAMEEVARTALGLNAPPPAPPAKTGHSTARKHAPPATPPAPAELEDEHFRVFELAYGSGATMVLTADTGGPLAQEKFVTLIAQPDLYGNVLTLFKSVTDGAHLDETPRMTLIDAVDALADNRGELLFELRGATGRQFALYRVLRGQANQIFITSPAYYGTSGEE